MISIAILIVVAHHFGWLDRWIWFVLESEARKAMNGAQVTLGSFSIVWAEILQGKITLHASNVVIPTPQRAEWRWDSPLIARIGKATVECNAPITVFHVVFLRREVPIEAYTIIIADVQVFVERRDSLINVFLLNPTLQMPLPPGEVKDKYDNADMSPLLPTKAKTDSHVHDSLLQPVQEGNITFFDNSSSASASDDVSSDHHQQAKVLVNEMLHAVQVLGGAAARGQLPGAIKQQGLELVGRLRGFREQENLEEGIRVMQQVGKVAVESLQSAPQLIMPKPDTSREGKKKIIYIRVGRIVIDDMRIFTKDSWINATTIQEGHDSSNTATAGAVEIPSKSNNSFYLPPSAKKINAGTSKNTATTIDINNKQNGSWNKPIYIERMVLRSSELSPSMSMVDCHNLPAIYHSVDKVVEVVLRRLLVEIAKSNTGKLFSTAIGEVLSVMVSNPHHSVPLPSTSNTTTNSSPAM